MPNDGVRIWAQKDPKVGISIHADIYYVLGLGSTGAGFDLAPVCASGKINKWSKYKPYQGHEQGYSQDGVTDPSPAGQVWGMTNGIRQNAATTYLGQFVNNNIGKDGWTYHLPVVGTHWGRVYDFDGYNHGAQPVTKAGATEQFFNENVDNMGQVKVINLFRDRNILFECVAGGDFNNLKVFWQNMPNLRYTIEVYQNYQLEAYAPPIAKWCSEPLATINGSSVGVIKSIREILAGAGISYIGLGGTSTSGALNLRVVSGLQEATKSGWFFGEDIVTNFKAGTGMNVEGATRNGNGWTGVVCPVPIGTWFDSAITNMTFGCRVGGASTPTMWNEVSQQGKYAASYATFYMKFDIAQQSSPFRICDSRNTTTEGVRLGAYWTNTSASTFSVIKGTLCSSNWANYSTDYIDIPAGTGTTTIYMRFDGILKTGGTSTSDSQRIRLMWSLKNNPSSSLTNSGTAGDWSNLSSVLKLSSGTDVTNGWYTGIKY